MFVLLIVVTYIVMTWGLSPFHKEIEPYTAEDIYYSIETKETVFDVTVEDVRKEKGKEDLYKLTFVNMLDRSIRMKLELEAPEFERIVGEGNNTVSSKMYTLTYYAPKRESYSHYAVALHRFTCFDQIPYSKEEVNAYATVLVDYANEVLSGSGGKFDTSSAMDITGSKLAEFTVTNLTKADIEALKPLPAHDPDYIDAPIIDDTVWHSDPVDYDEYVDSPDGGAENSMEADIGKEAEAHPLYKRVISWLTRAVVFI